MIVDLLMDIFSFLTKALTSFNLFVSLPIYLSVLSFVCRHRHRPPFNSSFYSLFFALGVVDISKYLLYLLKKCSYWGWVPPAFLPPDVPNLPANLLYAALWALALAQFQLNVLLSLNRLLSVFVPQLYRRQWRALSRWVLLFVFGTSLALALPIRWVPVCFRSTQIVLNPQNNMTKLTGPVFMDQRVQSAYYALTKLFVFTMLVFCLVGYPAMFWRVRKAQLVQDVERAVEVRMLYALVLLLIANFVYAVYLITWELLARLAPDPRLSTYAEWTLYVLIDFYDMNSPYGILLTSQLTRQSVLPNFLLLMFCRERRNSSAVSPEEQRDADGAMRAEGRRSVGENAERAPERGAEEKQRRGTTTRIVVVNSSDAKPNSE